MACNKLELADFIPIYGVKRYYNRIFKKLDELSDEEFRKNYSGALNRTTALVGLNLCFYMPASAYLAIEGVINLEKLLK